MQTFLPYPSFVESARCLDYKRLGKQRVETWQLYRANTENSGWRHTPIAKMWKGYERALLHYGLICCIEWLRLGYEDTLCQRFGDLLLQSKDPMILPPWIGDESLHASHRSNLLRKDPIWYGKYGWTEPNNLPYVWIK